MAWFGWGTSEKAPLRPSNVEAAIDKGRGVENLSHWASEAALSARGRGAPSRSYAASVPWDTLATLTFLSTFATLSFLIVYRTCIESTLPTLRDGYEFILLPGVVSLVAAFIFQVPRRVVREHDALVVEFSLGIRVTVPLEDVAELVALGSCNDYFRLLGRWSVFPFGTELRFFRGFPTMAGTVCVLLSSRCFSNFFLCLEPNDLIQFLVDNQKPLDLTARYQTAGHVLVRKGESLLSPEIGTVKPRHWLRVEKQVGRRVLVRFEQSGVEGWISYVSQSGHFLIRKEGSNSLSASQPVRGAVGASQLMRGYGATPSDAVELAGLIPVKRKGGLEDGLGETPE
eukprot:TRINITY_DN104247_c0_g1_i1.p1 TRINITY_DN104247_c0_g1~~TRINITY_DN104247_c0_g1_i1.p1  ORF type:complete len:342 (-),score=31.68 TRINITY_DN104247_c0_g1_i1:32-1057(-)